MSKIYYSTKPEELVLTGVSYMKIPYISKAMIMILVSLIFMPWYYIIGQGWKEEEHAEKLVEKHLETNKEEDKVAIVTGGNTGIGFQTCRFLVKAGYRVILACRSESKASEAIANLREELGEDILVEFIHLDLKSFASVRKFAEMFNKTNRKLNLLINNAGIMKMPYFEKTIDGFEQTFQVNHLSHFLLTNLLKEKLEQTTNSKVINLSSLAHYMASNGDFEDINDNEKYNDLANYSRAKAAVVMSTLAFNRRLSDKVKAYVVHPGVVYTELYRYDSFYAKATDIVGKHIMKTPLQGALTTLRLALLENNSKELYFADELPMKPNPWTKNIDLQDKLWDMSIKYTGLYKKE